MEVCKTELNGNGVLGKCPVEVAYEVKDNFGIELIVVRSNGQDVTNKLIRSERICLENDAMADTVDRLYGDKVVQH